MCLCNFFKTADNPDRLKHYLQQTEKQDWKSTGLATLTTIFTELTRLAYDDVNYYIRVRKKHRKYSQLTRWSAWLFGSMGVLVPLLPPSLIAIFPFKVEASWGYPLLAVAGSLTLLNRILGSTQGHVRYVTAQLALEHRITRFHLSWSRWLAQHPDGTSKNSEIDEAFDLFRDFAIDAYKIVQNETVAWGVAVISDMELLNQQSASKSSRSGGAGQDHSATDVHSKAAEG